jgi:hypothetical protein
VSTQGSTVLPLYICAGLLLRGHVLSAGFAVVKLAALGLLRVICVGGTLRVIAVGVWIISSTRWSWRPVICARDGGFSDIGHDVDSGRLR